MDPFDRIDHVDHVFNESNQTQSLRDCGGEHVCRQRDHVVEAGGG